MTKSAASEEALGELHTKVAKVMTRALDQIEKVQDVFDSIDEPELEQTVLRPEVSPAMLSAITKFLSDNKVTCNPAESADMSDLQKRLSTKRRRSVGNVVAMHDEPEG